MSKLTYSFTFASLFLIPIFTAAAAVLRTPPNNLGLVGYWSMEDGSGSTATDFSGNGNTGTLTNMDPESDWVAGKRGGALDFDGSDDYVDAGSSISMENVPYTVTFWMKFDSGVDLSNGGDKMQITGKDDGGDSKGWWLGRVPSDATNDIRWGTHTGNIKLNTANWDRWHHVVLVQSSKSSATAYIDGVENRSGDNGFDGHALGDPLKIGSNDSSESNTFNGKIDEVRIYNRALSDSDIRDLYQSGYAEINRTAKVEEVGDPVGWWTFDGKDMDFSGSTPTAESGGSATKTYGEAGTFESTTDGSFKTINFDNSYTNPVVVGTANTDNSTANGGSGGDGSAGGLIFESKNVSSNSADMRICKQVATISNDGCQPLSTSETVGYMVIDADDVSEVSGLDAGTFSDSNNVDSSQSVSFNESFGSAPKVFTSVQTVDGGDPIETRAWSVGTGSFTGSICHQNSNDGCDSSHGSETVGWIAIEPGNIPFEQQTEIGSTRINNSDWSSNQSFASSFNATPVGIVEQETENGGQESEVDEARDITGDNMEVRYCEIDSDSKCNSHTTEGVAWFAVTAGDLTVDGLSDASLEGGMDNGSVGPGRIGQALSFDGTDDEVNAGDIPIEVNSNDDAITLSAWVKPKKLGNTGFREGRPILNKDDDSNNREWFWQFEGSNGLFFRTVSGNNAGTPDVWTTNEWQHAVVVWDVGTNIVTYRNGSKIDSSDETDTSPNTSEPVLIGNASVSNQFDGKIDDVRIYDQALSADEVQKIYDATRPSEVNASQSNELTDGLVGMWSFDGPSMDFSASPSTAADVSSNSNTGTLNGGMASAIGNIGQALEFDGVNDYVEAPGIYLPDAMTVSTWFKREGSTSGEGFQSLVSRWGIGNSYALVYNDNDNVLRFSVDNLSPNSRLTAPVSVEDNQWHHAIGVWDGDDMYLYLDGKQIGSVAASGTPDDNNKSIRIGYDGTGFGNAWWNGAIDNTRIYNRALSENEIELLYNLGR